MTDAERRTVAPVLLGAWGLLALVSRFTEPHGILWVLLLMGQMAALTGAWVFLFSAGPRPPSHTRLDL